ncbi:6-phosphofructokinase [Christensenella tenuis]|uniref:ATP-dependent 6-phosphofructokinase n=1 Tax=Christensenella tenuis TaxID=2763033 RepID=A0ABR7EC82_9FIRM|nr:ATP-dependent 6-phosphofructokinase [Christensenella tenuis]MBC5647382.1 6-phosphofructokinase [Christensenella tenuis]
MTKRIGILTSGGDCPGLNAAIRGVARAAYDRMEGVEIIGIADGYSGLIKGDYRVMDKSEFSGILTLGGTILGTARTPFKDMRKIGDDNVDKVSSMVKNYEKMGLDCLCTLGGNGTHKTANLLSEEGLNVIGLPKTIDNDLWGTDVTFGFHTAVDIATDVIDRVHTTAASHGRVMVVELMGNKAGWLTIYAGVAGGADVVVIPEIPYDRETVIEAVRKRAERGKAFSIVAIAEGAIRNDEADLKRKEIREKRSAEGFTSVSARLAHAIEATTGIETRVVVPGHIQRGGSPSAYDRVLSTKFGVQAAELIYQKKFGYTVALQKDKLTQNKLSDVAGKTKFVTPDSDIVRAARNIGICLGD